MKNYFHHGLILATAFLLLAATISAQTFQSDGRLKYYLKDFKNLDSLSDAYFQKGDIAFLTIDAYRDGLVKLAKDVDFKYYHDTFRLRNQLIPEPYNSRYMAKIHERQNKMYPRSDTYTARFEFGSGTDIPGEKVFVHEVRDEYAMRKQWHHDIQQIEAQRLVRYDKNAAALIQTLHKNNIITDETPYALVEFKWDGIYINNQKIADTILLNTCAHFLSNMDAEFKTVYFNKDDINKYCTLNR